MSRATARAIEVASHRYKGHQVGGAHRSVLVKVRVVLDFEHAGVLQLGQLPAFWAAGPLVGPPRLAAVLQLLCQLDA